MKAKAPQDPRTPSIRCEALDPSTGPRGAETRGDDAVIRTAAARVHEARVRAEAAFALWTAMADSGNAAADAAWDSYAAAVAGVQVLRSKIRELALIKYDPTCSSAESA